MRKLLIDCPKLVEEWNYNKNIDLDPKTISINSNKSVWWICENKHEWIASVAKRTSRNQGCPYCSGRYAIKGETDLATTNPQLLEEWDYINNKISPQEIKAGSHKKVWWKCPNGHSYESVIYNKVIGYKCPFCSGKKVLKGYNDLFTTNPELAIDWDYEKNKELNAETVSRGSEKKVWWKCNLCKFEWNTKINQRAVGRSGCPNCHNYHGTSFPEQAIYYYLNKLKYNVSNRTKINNLEIDIYLPDFSVGIEYDGLEWHKNSLDRDNNKDCICKENDIKLIRIREAGLEKTCNAINIMRKNKTHKDLEKCILKIFEIINISYNDINIERDRNSIISNYMINKENNSLKHQYPKLSEEWDMEKNFPVKPEMVSPMSNEKYWWICSKCFNKWESSVSSRTMGTNCPICANSIRQKTRNKNKIKNGLSLKDKNPELLAEWDFQKNKIIKPDEISYGSSQKAWWLCSKGHSYEATINVRTNLGVGCPFCSGKKILKGFNDLTTSDPEIAKEWNYDKNKDITPSDVSRGSHKKVWWKCCNNHEWQAIINKRTIRNQKCPYCK